MRGDNGLPRFARDDVAFTEYDPAISRRDAPEVFKNHTPRSKRAQGMPGARCTRGLVCKNVQRAHTSIQVQTGASRHSLRNGFTAYTALSPVTGLSCHRRLARLHAKLDASVGASGPHDFAVRTLAFRQTAPPPPPPPVPR